MSGLLPNQTYVRDERGITWVCTVNKEDMEFFKSRGKIDDKGDLHLTMPEIAALKKLTPKMIVEEVERYVGKLKIPDLSAAKQEIKTFELPDLHILSNKQLEELLSFFGGYRSYLESRLADAELKRDILMSGFEEASGRAGYHLVKTEYREQRRPTKEMIQAEVLNSDPLLLKTKHQIVEANAICKKLAGLKEAYKSYYETVSRVVALRLQSKDIL